MKARESLLPQLEIATAPPAALRSELHQVYLNAFIYLKYIKDMTFLFYPLQGQFKINLSGTGFKVADDTSWITHGNYAVADIHKSQV